VEDYEEKLREVEGVFGPIIKHVGRQGLGHGTGWRATRRDARLVPGERRMDNKRTNG
jgi:hypothetical protein